MGNTVLLSVEPNVAIDKTSHVFPFVLCFKSKSCSYRLALFICINICIKFMFTFCNVFLRKALRANTRCQDPTVVLML